MQKKFYTLIEAGEKLNISQQELKRFIQERSIYVVKDKGSGNVMIHEQDVEYLSKEFQSLKEESKSGDQFYPLDKVLTLLQIEEDQLKLMVAEGKIKSYKVGGKIKFKKDEIERLKRELMIEPTIVVSMDKNIDDDDLNIEELEEVVEDSGKGYASLKDFLPTTSALQSSQKPAAATPAQSAPAPTQQRPKPPEDPPKPKTTLKPKTQKTSKKPNALEEILPETKEITPKPQDTPAVPSAVSGVRESVREPVMQDLTVIYIHGLKFKLQGLTLAIIFNGIALLLYFAKVPQLSFDPIFKVILALVVALWNFTLFAATRKQENMATAEIKNVLKSFKEKSSLKVRTSFFKEVLDTLESAFPIFWGLLLSAFLWFGLAILAVLQIS